MNEDSTNARPPRRRRRRTIIVVLLIGLAAALHTHWLPWIAAGLVGPVGTSGRTEYVLLISGDRMIDTAAELIQAGRCSRVVLTEWEPDRLTEAGILPRMDQVQVERLQKLGVRRSQIEVIPFEERPWQAIFAEWHIAHGQPTVTALCEELDLSSSRYEMRTVLSPEQFTKLTWYPLRNRNYAPHNWWTSRRGVKAIALGYVDLVTTWLIGPQPPVARDQWWDPDKYEQSLRELK